MSSLIYDARHRLRQNRSTSQVTNLMTTSPRSPDFSVMLFLQPEISGSLQPATPHPVCYKGKSSTIINNDIDKTTTRLKKINYRVFHPTFAYPSIHSLPTVTHYFTPRLDHAEWGIHITQITVCMDVSYAAIHHIKESRSSYNSQKPSPLSAYHHPLRRR